MKQGRLTRRSALGLLAGSALTLPSGGWGQDGSGIGGTGIDAGIGGTGIESGIGGTGIFGLIEGFSSIWVNDLRVEIPSSAQITLNGRPASELDLALGQTVAVQAVEGSDGTLQAARIDANFALVGPISQIAQHKGRWIFIILGQQVVVSALTEVGSVQAGDWVTVLGLRDHRGSIQAANVQPTDSREAVVTGIVSADGRVDGVEVLLTDGSALPPGARATIQGPLTREAQPRIVATAASIRPASLFDPREVNTLILTGLPGEQDGTLFVDGYRIAVPGVLGQLDPNIAGLEGRLHGRFQSQGGRFRSQGSPSASRQPRAPFAGTGRRGPGSQQPNRSQLQRSTHGVGGSANKPRNKPSGKNGAGKGRR